MDLAGDARGARSRQVVDARGRPLPAPPPSDPDPLSSASLRLDPGHLQRAPAPVTNGPTDLLRSPLPGTANENPEYDIDEPTMAEKLAALNLPAGDGDGETTEITAVVPPNADSVHVLLRQALRADDRAALLGCLSNRDDKSPSGALPTAVGTTRELRQSGSGDLPVLAAGNTRLHPEENTKINVVFLPLSEKYTMFDDTCKVGQSK